MKKIWKNSMASLFICALTFCNGTFVVNAEESETDATNAYAIEQAAESGEEEILEQASGEEEVPGQASGEEEILGQAFGEEDYKLVVRDIYAHPGDTIPISDFVSQVYGIKQETPGGLYEITFPVDFRFSAAQSNGFTLNPDKTMLTVDPNIMDNVKGGEYVNTVRVECYRTSGDGSVLVEGEPQLRIHSVYGEWEDVSAATVFTPAKQTRKCTMCGKRQERIGSKLTATITPNVSTIPLKTKQSTKKFCVTLTAGDSVAAWTTSNGKVATVSGTADGSCTIKAGKKPGTAKITIRTKAGAVKAVKVKVQKGAVKTSAIKQVPKKITLKKGETYKLSPSLQPITSSDKAKYSSSNKKIASVSNKGVIKGKKSGKTKITVKAGKKKVICTVRVKNSI